MRQDKNRIGAFGLYGPDRLLGIQRSSLEDFCGGQKYGTFWALVPSSWLVIGQGHPEKSISQK
jgi:hypothetical protein